MMSHSMNPRMPSGNPTKVTQAIPAAMGALIPTSKPRPSDAPTFSADFMQSPANCGISIINTSPYKINAPLQRSRQK